MYNGWGEYRSGWLPEPEVRVTTPIKLAELDIDRQPSPSGQVATETEWQLQVRGWGVVVISIDGVRLLRRAELVPGLVESWGPSWR